MSKKKIVKDQAAELDGKIQVTGQESASDDSMKVEVPGSSTDTEIKEVEEPKSAINTRKAAEAVASGRASNTNGVITRGAVLFSGGAGGDIRDDMSATSKEESSYKSGDRAGRRADSITRKIDYVDAEVIETKVYRSKPLSETDAKQGYNGNYFNEHVITQRASGGVPSDPIYERSVDTNELDLLYYPRGQYNSGKVKQLSIRNWNPSLNSGNGGYDAATNITLGNYLHRSLTVTFNQYGQITTFSFAKDNLDSGKLDEPTYRLAADHYLRFINQSELDRNVMISVAGNESDPSWSCLGDAIVDASDQNRLLSLLETMVGDFVTLSGRKLGTALAHQINKVAKDGPRVTGPMSEMVNGNIAISGYGADGSVSELNGRNYCFSKTAYHAGGAGLYLAVSDSLAKYTTKGKLLSLPLSFKNAYSIMKSNADPLRVDDLFIQELKTNELYSTIDGPYDPLKPLTITDKAGIVYPIPLDLGLGTITSGEMVDKGKIYTMHYENLRNKYNINVRNYFGYGLFRWFADRGERFYDALKANSSDTSDHTVVIPIVSSTTSISLWDLVVCAATPYIIEERLTAQTELLKYEKNHGYPYTGSSAIKDVDIDAADNYTFNGIEKEITASTAKPVSAMKVIMPEVFWPKIKFKAKSSNDKSIGGIGAYVVLPHYFVQNQFKYDKAVGTSMNRKLLLSDEGATMAYPSFRSGNMLSYADTIYGMSEEDYRLSLDRMVVYPGYEGTNGGNASITTKFCMHDDYSTTGIRNSAFTYKYGLVSDGTPVLPYFAYASSAAKKENTLTVKDILSTPRELGLVQVAPAGVLSPIRTGASTLNTVSVDSSYLGLSGPGFRVKIYHADGTTMSNAILNAGSTNINNNASVKYVYDVVFATPYDAQNVANGLDLFSQTAITSLNPFVESSYEPTESTFDFSTGTYITSESNIIADTENIDKDVFPLYSDQRYVWTRLQRLPYVVNPFDCNVDSLTSVASANNDCEAINTDDIFDFMHYFGFAGFRASDYTELAYLRNKERIAKGMNYVSDPFVDKSLLLK